MKNLMFVLILSFSFASCKKEETAGPQDLWEYNINVSHTLSYSKFSPNDGFNFGMTDVGSYGGDAKSGKGAGAVYTGKITFDAVPTTPVVLWIKVRKNKEDVFEGYLDNLTPNTPLEYNYQMSFN